MAIAKVADVIQSGNVQIPANRYSLRVKEAITGKSKSSGNDMLTLNCEIYAPAVLETEEGKFSIDGARVTHYITLTKEGEVTLGRLVEFCKRCNIALPEEFDTENVDITPFQGLKFDARLDSEARVSRQRPKSGQKVGDPIMDDDGKPIISGWDVRITDVYGLAAR